MEAAGGLGVGGLVGQLLLTACQNKKDKKRCDDGGGATVAEAD